MADCICADWKENIDKMLMASYLLLQGIVYDGVKMRYCPWCGGKLLESPKEAVSQIEE